MAAAPAAGPLLLLHWLLLSPALFLLHAAPAASAAVDPAELSWEAARARASEVVAQMTADEKYSLLQGHGFAERDPLPGMYVGNVRGVPRLGVPPLRMHDGPQGWRTNEVGMIDTVTAWPCALAVTATWDVGRMREWAAAMATEFRLKGANVILGPSVDIARVAASGRAAESVAGEDPYLGAAMAVSYVTGVQSNGVLATIKHFILNNQENFRFRYDSRAGDRTLWEVYYPPYEAAIQAADVASVMCSYNRVNSRYACEQGATLEDDLRGAMGFRGWVMSDWWASMSVGAADVGLDQELPGNMESNFFSPERLREGVAMPRIDLMATRILTPMAKFGLLNGSACDPSECNVYANVTTPQHRALARRLAAESAVLLKNDGGLLPISGVSTIAVLGSACVASNPTSDIIWNDASYYYLGGSGRVLSTRTEGILEGVSARARRAGIRVVNSTSQSVLLALEAAKQADLALVCGGAISAEDYDRLHLHLYEEEFIHMFLSQTRTPTAVLMMSPGAVLTPWRQRAAAIVNIFLAGEATAGAWADVLFGDVNPSGRLPVTFPQSPDAVRAPCRGPGECAYSEGLEVGYRALGAEAVAFPFGHGLSYTTFAYRGHSPARPCGRADRSVCLSVTVENTGPAAGAEVAQLYLRFPEAFGEPPRLLKGFRKVPVPPGASVAVDFALAERDLSAWDSASRSWRLANGTFVAHVGASSQDLRVEYTFDVLSDFHRAQPPPETAEEAGRGHPLLPDCAWSNYDVTCPPFDLGAEFVVAQLGVKACPGGTVPIADAETCRRAQQLSGFAWSDHRDDGGVCNWWGGFREAGQPFHVSLTGPMAKWVCLKRDPSAHGSPADAAAAAAAGPARAEL